MQQISTRLRIIGLALAIAAAVLCGIAIVTRATVVSAVVTAMAIVANLCLAMLLNGAAQVLNELAAEHEDETRKVRSQFISNVRHQKEIVTKYEQTAFFSNLLKSIAAGRGLKDALDVILDQSMRFFNAQSGFVMLVDEETQELYVEHAVAIDGDPVPPGRLQIGEGVAGRVAATGEPRLIAGGKTSGDDTQTLMCVPLRIQEKIIGVITLEDRPAVPFTEPDLEFFCLIGQETSQAIEKAQLYQKMETMSITDALTGLWNRRYLDTRLHAEMKRALRTGEELSITMLDIDKFKSVNDTYGHSVGDNVLKGVAAVLRDTVREMDMVARYGGEEFIIVSISCNRDQARKLAERVRLAIKAAEYEGNEERPIMKVTVSMGVATFPHDATEEHALVGHSDDALYLAKESGRDQVRIYPEVLEHAAATTA